MLENLKKNIKDLKLDQNEDIKIVEIKNIDFKNYSNSKIFCYKSFEEIKDLLDKIFEDYNINDLADYTIENKIIYLSFDSNVSIKIYL